MFLHLFDRQLRSLSSLISLSPDQLSSQSPDADAPVSPFIILLLLFGHAGPDLTSPHTAAGWSNEKVLAWLDDHTSNKERYRLLKTMRKVTIFFEWINCFQIGVGDGRIAKISHDRETEEYYSIRSSLSIHFKLFGKGRKMWKLMIARSKFESRLLCVYFSMKSIIFGAWISEKRNKHKVKKPIDWKYIRNKTKINIRNIHIRNK